MKHCCSLLICAMLPAVAGWFIGSVGTRQEESVSAITSEQSALSHGASDERTLSLHTILAAAPAGEFPRLADAASHSSEPLRRHVMLLIGRYWILKDPEATRDYFEASETFAASMPDFYLMWINVDSSSFAAYADFPLKYANTTELLARLAIRDMDLALSLAADPASETKVDEVKKRVAERLQEKESEEQLQQALTDPVFAMTDGKVAMVKLFRRWMQKEPGVAIAYGMARLNEEEDGLSSLKRGQLLRPLAEKQHLLSDGQFAQLIRAAAQLGELDRLEPNVIRDPFAVDPVPTFIGLPLERIQQFVNHHIEEVKHDSRLASFVAAQIGAAYPLAGVDFIAQLADDVRPIAEWSWFSEWESEKTGEAVQWATEQPPSSLHYSILSDSNANERYVLLPQVAELAGTYLSSLPDDERERQLDKSLKRFSRSAIELLPQFFLDRLRSKPEFLDETTYLAAAASAVSGLARDDIDLAMQWLVELPSVSIRAEEADYLFYKFDIFETYTSLPNKMKAAGAYVRSVEPEARLPFLRKMVDQVNDDDPFLHSFSPEDIEPLVMQADVPDNGKGELLEQLDRQRVQRGN